MVHAGWRGLAGGVLEEGVARCASSVRRARSPRRSAPARAVLLRGRRRGARSASPASATGATLDLKAIARGSLRAAGVDSVQDVGLLHDLRRALLQHRRDGGVTGRQAGVAWLS